MIALGPVLGSAGIAHGWRPAPLPTFAETVVNEAHPESIAKESPVEGTKRDSQYLLGAMPTELVDGTDGISKDSANLIKHHGSYQQEDRDGREASRKGADDVDTRAIFMVRTRIPGGRLTSPQLLAELDLCDELGNTTLRVTSRQGLQLHGVLKQNLRPAIARINEIQLTTLGACGDVNRNVMCCPAPSSGPIHDELQRLAQRLADHFAPRTAAYHELWLTDPATGEKRLAGGGAEESWPSLPGVGSSDPAKRHLAGDEVEPIYGRQYLPRKFKMAIGLPHDNCIDIYTNDLGLLAVVRDGRIVGYNLLAGGGQGVTPAVKRTFPALAHRVGFFTPDQVVAAAEAVVRVQRDHGNRADRKQARLKYLIHEWGLDKFRGMVAEYLGEPITPCEPDDVTDIDDHMGWSEQGDGRWCYGLNIENGRILDNDRMRLKSALREVCRSLQPGIRLTAHQSILFTDLADSQRGELERILRAHDVPLTESISNARRWSMACVAWPTCGLSITESERALPGIMDQLDAELRRQGLEQERFTVRMTGCPNGCARPYNCDIGLVGKARDRYTLLVGGRPQGDRLNFVLKDLVPRDEIVPTLAPVLAYFKRAKEGAESFGDFCARKGLEDLTAQS